MVRDAGFEPPPQMRSSEYGIRNEERVECRDRFRVLACVLRSCEDPIRIGRGGLWARQVKREARVSEQCP